MNRYVRLSRSVALSLIALSRNLFQEGTGVDLDRDTIPSESRGFIDDIPIDDELHGFVNHLLWLARHIFVILKPLVDNDASSFDRLLSRAAQEMLEENKENEI